jgi:multimeric flavodoxin WrbA
MKVGNDMNVLIINMLPIDDTKSVYAINKIKQTGNKCTVINVFEEKVNACRGCYSCWFKTPGTCFQKDICEDIIKAYLKNDVVIYITKTALDTVHYKTKNVIDRVLFCSIIPLDEFRDNETFHICRYNKKYKFGIVYIGSVDVNLMNFWMNRLALNNVTISSLGAHNIENMEGLLKCIQ